MLTTGERTTTLYGGSSSGDDPSQGGAMTVTKQVRTITQSGQGLHAGSAESSTIQGGGSLSTQQEV